MIFFCLYDSSMVHAPDCSIKFELTDLSNICQVSWYPLLTCYRQYQIWSSFIFVLLHVKDPWDPLKPSWQTGAVEATSCIACSWSTISQSSTHTPKILLTDETVLAKPFASLAASPSQDCVAWAQFDIKNDNLRSSKLTCEVQVGRANTQHALCLPYSSLVRGHHSALSGSQTQLTMSCNDDV